MQRWFDFEQILELAAGDLSHYNACGSPHLFQYSCIARLASHCLPPCILSLNKPAAAVHNTYSSARTHTPTYAFGSKHTTCSCWIHDKQIDRGNPSPISDAAEPKVKFALSMSLVENTRIVIYSIQVLTAHFTAYHTAPPCTIAIYCSIFNSCEKIAKIERENVLSRRRRRCFVPVRAMKWSLLNVSFMFINLIYTFFVAHTHTAHTLATDVAVRVQCIYTFRKCNL